MEVTSSILVLLLIFGLGLSGASYNQCSDTLSSNGYSLTDSQVQTFYEAANDPDNISFINSNSDYFSNQWESIEVISDSSSWYGNYISDPVDVSSVDNLFSSSSSSQQVSVNSDDYYANPAADGRIMMISDGHGGYYLSTLRSHSDNISYDIYHYDSNGNSFKLSSNVAPSGFYYYTFYVEELADGSQVCHLLRTMVSTGNVADMALSPVTFSDSKTGEIEEVKSDEFVDVSINPDGSITLSDGTLVYPNADGTYTINGTDYAPSAVIPDYNELLRQLLDLQRQIDDLKYDLTNDNDTTYNNVSEAVDEAVSSYEGDFSEFLLNSRITQVFPFCLPFDFVRGLKLLSSDPVAPCFDIDFNIPAFGAYPGTNNVITLDLAVYSKYFTVVRWVTTILFVISLCFITYKLIKW